MTLHSLFLFNRRSGGPRRVIHAIPRLRMDSENLCLQNDILAPVGGGSDEPEAEGSLSATGPKENFPPMISIDSD